MSELDTNHICPPEQNPDTTPSANPEEVQHCSCNQHSVCEWGDCHLRGISITGCGRSDHQLNTFDYLADVPGNVDTTDFVEVQFKNTRKSFFRNDNHLDLHKGDVVAVEAFPGHDIGTVTLTGKLVLLQMQKANLRQGFEIKRVYRKARPSDLEKYEEAKSREYDTMIRSRQIAKELELQMKIGDVEYQGDGNKAIFYYIADQRVDFRKLIKVLADAFHVRIEMKQIGARQEAGRIGGIGPCGRELCCATWMKNFSSVSTAAARYQDITPNPQKLAGQCAKLKCCLNYEVDTYIEAARNIPDRSIQLLTDDSTYYFFKVDTLAGLVTYSSDRRMAANLTTISFDRAHEIIAMNERGEKPLSLEPEGPVEPKRPVDLAEQDDLTRFDKSRRKNGGKNNKRQNDKSGNPRRERNGKREDRNDRGPREPRNNESRNEGGQNRNRRDRGEKQQNAAPKGNNTAPRTPNAQQ